MAASAASFSVQWVHRSTTAIPVPVYLRSPIYALATWSDSKMQSFCLSSHIVSKSNSLLCTVVVIKNIFAPLACCARGQLSLYVPPSPLLSSYATEERSSLPRSHFQGLFAENTGCRVSTKKTLHSIYTGRSSPQPVGAIVAATVAATIAPCIRPISRC